MIKPKQLENIWEAQFGDDYLARNDIKPESRLEALKEIFQGLAVNSILEIGCSRGHNLAALKIINPKFNVFGIEPNQKAAEAAKKEFNGLNIVEGSAFEHPFADNFFDLVMTACVLIHISTNDLKKATDTMYRLSNKYILAIEYFDEQDEIEVKYRGMTGALWRRNFEKWFLTNYLGLKLLKKGFLAKESGFDNCGYLLLEKQDKDFEAGKKINN